MNQMSSVDRHRPLVEKIRSTAIFRRYASAFEDLTGLRLALEVMHDPEESHSSEPNSFCGQLAGISCRVCRSAHLQVMREGSEQAATHCCPMGLTETAVPVRFGDETIAVLRTGQLRHASPSQFDIEAMVKALRGEGIDAEGLEKLIQAYERVPVMPRETYDEAVMMLAIFSLHLTSLIDQLLLAQQEAEPVVVTNAKRYIEEHLDEKLSLEEVAGAVGVSSFYFCKVFKQTLDMTFTEYVNRCRVEWAKEALRDPRRSVTEIAFEVGYQSLSQFNRCFLRYAGESPTKFRKHAVVAGASVPAGAAQVA